jgi:7-cyano-7-deazaguanine synthase
LAPSRRFDWRKYRITPIPRRVAVLASGGLDSSVLLAELAERGYRVFPLYVRAGLKWERLEFSVLNRFIASLNSRRVEPVAVLRFPMDDLIPGHWSITGRKVPGYRAALSSNYIPGRNFGLLAKAAIFCAVNRIPAVAIGPLADNPFPDARPEFFRTLARAVEEGTGLALKISAPYAGLSKAQVIRRGRTFPLHLTLSCARPKGQAHCGACTKCAERKRAFKEAGVEDPTRYLNAR